MPVKYHLLDNRGRCTSRIISACVVFTLGTTAIVTATAVKLFALSSARGHKENRPTPYWIPLPSAEVVDNVTLGSPLPPDPTCTWTRADTPAQICSHDTEVEGERKCSKYIDEMALMKRSGMTGFSASGIDDGMPADKEWTHGAAPVYLCARNATRTALIGPFSSRVQEWHTIHVLLSMLSPGDRIVKYTGDTVSADDASTPIGYPPLHMHHVHVYASHAPHWFETHGDYLLDAHGHSLSWRTAAPSPDAHGHSLTAAPSPPDAHDYSLSSPPLGSCVVVQEEGPTKVFAQMNDVRFSTSTGMASGSSRAEQTEHDRASLDELRATGRPYRWYFRIRFVLEPSSAPPLAAAAASVVTVSDAEPPPTAPIAVASTTANGCQPVHKVVLMYPQDEHASHDYLGRFDCGGRQALFTYSIELTYSGTVVPPSWMHTHRARHGGYVLIRGSHTLFSLVVGAADSSSDVGNTTGAQGKYAAFMRDLAAMPASERVARLRRTVLELAGARALCYDDEHVPTSVTFNETGDGIGGRFDRQGAIVCEPFRFQAGERVTAFSFVSPNWAQDLKVFPQHTMLFLMFRPDPTAHDPPPPPIKQQWPEDFYVLDLDRSLTDARALHCKLWPRPTTCLRARWDGV